MSHDAQPQPAAQERAPIGFGAILTTAMALAAFMPPAIGVLGPFLIADLELNRAQIGVLASAVPLVGALCAPLAGTLVDRFGGRRMLVLLFSVVGAALLALAVAPSFMWLVVATSLAGIGFALGNSATNQLITVHIPPGRQGVLVGVKQSGVQIGGFIAGAALPGLALALGWRGATASAGVVALLGILGIFTWVSGDGPRSAWGTRASRRAERSAHTRWPAVRWLSLYALFMGAGNSAVITYVPLYAFEHVGLTVTGAGIAAGTMALVAAATRIGWARASERLWRPESVLLALAAAAVISQVVTIAAGWVPLLLWAGVVGLGATAIAWNGVVMLFVVRGAPRALTGRITGTIQLAFALGMFSSPYAFGLVVDVTEKYWIAWGGVAVTHALAGALIVLGRDGLRATAAR